MILRLIYSPKITGAFLFRIFGGFFHVPTTQIYCLTGAIFSETCITNIYLNTMHDLPQYFASGNKWQSIVGELTHITVGRAGVWGLTPDGQASMLPTTGKIILPVFQVPARFLGQFLLEKCRNLSAQIILRLPVYRGYFSGEEITDNKFKLEIIYPLLGPFFKKTVTITFKPILTGRLFSVQNHPPLKTHIP